MAADDLSGEQITQLIQAWQAGDTEAFAQLMDRVYHQLHKLAHQKRMNEFGAGDMQTTVLLNEVCMILRDKQDVRIENRQHFYHLAGLAMYRFLVDQARIRHNQRNGGKLEHSLFDDEVVDQRGLDHVQILWVNRALERMEKEDPELVEIIKLRFFAGYTIKETAKILKLPVIQVNRRWAFAKLWLKDLLDEQAQNNPDPPPPAPH